MLNKSKIHYVALAFVALFFMSAVAQAESDAGSILREMEASQPRQLPQFPPPELQEIPPRLVSPSGAVITIKAINFTGVEGIIQDNELQVLVADAIGKEFDFSGLKALTDRLSHALKQRGWFLARAYLPRQDVTDGTIEIGIIIGQLNSTEPYQVEKKGVSPLRIKPEVLYGIGQKALPAGEPAREEALDRGILLMNDLAGVQARARLEPGSKPGSSQVVLLVEEAPLFSGSVGADNHGSLGTGRNQINANGSVNNPSGYGDLITVGLSHTKGVDLGQLNYSFPLASNGLKLNLAAVKMRYQLITAEGVVAGLEGDTKSIAIGLSFPWLRGRNSNLYSTISQTQKWLKDDSTVGTLRDKNITFTNLTLAGDHLDKLWGGGINSANLKMTLGNLDLSAVPDEASFDAMSYRTAGYYSKLNYTFSRLQKLPSNFTLYANFSGQQAASNLDSSEKFLAGGVNAVRAYPSGEGSADSGQLFSVELQYDWPRLTTFGKLQLQAFYDRAHVRLHKNNYSLAINSATGESDYSIQGFGFGFNLTQLGKYSIQTVVASKIGSNPGRSLSGEDGDGKHGTIRFWLQGMWWF